jgi:hypothetical protein
MSFFQEVFPWPRRPRLHELVARARARARTALLTVLLGVVLSLLTLALVAFGAARLLGGAP